MRFRAEVLMELRRITQQWVQEAQSLSNMERIVNVCL